MNLPDPPWGRRQSESEAIAIKPRWLKRLAAKLPQGVPGRTRMEGWPATYGSYSPSAHTSVHHPDERGENLQCGGCRYFVPLEGDLGDDWGACTCAFSEYDGRVVLTLWTCRRFDR